MSTTCRSAKMRRIQQCFMSLALFGACVMYWRSQTDLQLAAHQPDETSHVRHDSATSTVSSGHVWSGAVTTETDVKYKKLSFHEEEKLEKMYQQIQTELRNYSLDPAVGVHDITQLMPQFGGLPVINLVVTTWRSGSTFVGDLLNAHPATIYHYEPLHDFGITRPRHGSLASTAQRYLNQLMTCNYTHMERFIGHGKKSPSGFDKNKLIWPVCSSGGLCQNADFLARSCALFPFQLMKTVRVPLNLTGEILKNEKLDVRVLLLVRDPRGTMQSRRHQEWCTTSPDCGDPAVLCADLVSDYHAAQRLSQLFPGRVRVMRFEDLSLNVDRMSREIYDFFRLPYVKQVAKFLSTHTTKTQGGPFSTFRNSKTTPFHWQKDLSFLEVEDIQSKCHRAMDLFKYRLARSEENLHLLNPLGNFTFSV